MNGFEICICIIASLYTLIYGLDVCVNIYQNKNNDTEEEEDGTESLSADVKELPEYVKRMYS